MLRVFRVLCVVGALSVFFATARAFQVPTSPCANPSRVAGGRAPLSVRARVPAALKPRTVLKAGFFDNLLGGGSSGSSGSDKVDDKVPEWAELIDEASGKPYYWNQLTGETSWVPPSSVLTMPLPDPENDNLLSDEDYYAKITARVDAEGGPKKDFGELVEFPVMYDGWFSREHEWMGADGETPKVVDGRAAVALGRQIEQQAIAAVRAALANGVNRMEVRFDCVPNLEEVELGTALNQQFSFEVREDLGLEDVKFKTEVRRNLVDWANHNWACKLVAGIADTEQPVFIQHCCAQDFSKAKSVGDNVWVGRLGKVARQLTAGDLSVVVNPGVEDQWRKALKFSAPDSPLIYLNSISGGWTYELGGPIKEVEQVYYMKRVSKGWIFRSYPGPWQALVERPDGSVQVLETYEKRPLLRDASKVVREYSFEKFAIFNDRYAKGFGGRL